MFCPNCGKEMQDEDVHVLVDSSGEVTYDIYCRNCGVSGWFSPDEEEAEEQE